MWGRHVVCAALITVVGAVSGCTSTSTRAPKPIVAGSGAPVVVPGGPGDQGRTAKPGERIRDQDTGSAAADVRFAEAMIPHHRQALEMAALAGSRTSDDLVLALAERITRGQAPEITVMTSWLRSLGRPAPEAHDHQAAYGMATLEQMNRLRTARGAAFDTLFLELMIRHHEGAVTMAGEELRRGTDRAMRKMAQDVIAGQQIEITRMRGILRSSRAYS